MAFRIQKISVNGDSWWERLAVATGVAWRASNAAEVLPLEGPVPLPVESLPPTVRPPLYLVPKSPVSVPQPPSVGVGLGPLLGWIGAAFAVGYIVGDWVENQRVTVAENSDSGDPGPGRDEALPVEPFTEFPTEALGDASEEPLPDDAVVPPQKRKKEKFAKELLKEDIEDLRFYATDAQFDDQTLKDMIEWYLADGKEEALQALVAEESTPASMRMKRILYQMFLEGEESAALVTHMAPSDDNFFLEQQMETAEAILHKLLLPLAREGRLPWIHVEPFLKTTIEDLHQPQDVLALLRALANGPEISSRDGARQYLYQILHWADPALSERQIEEIQGRAGLALANVYAHSSDTEALEILGQLVLGEDWETLGMLTIHSRGKRSAWALDILFDQDRVEELGRALCFSNDPEVHNRLFARFKEGLDDDNPRMRYEMAKMLAKVIRTVRSGDTRVPKAIDLLTRSPYRREFSELLFSSANRPPAISENN